MSAPHAPSAAQQINKAKDVLYDMISDRGAMNSMWSVFHVVALRCTHPDASVRCQVVQSPLRDDGCAGDYP